MRSLLFASAAIALVAVSAPSVFKRYVEQPARQADATVNAVAEPAGTSNAATEVAIGVASDGHFYVDADINDRSVRMMVDTGATVIALRQSDAEEAGIRFRPGDFTHPVQTANGATNAAETELRSVAIEHIEIDNVRALVIPDDQLAISLLGGSFLSRLSRVEIANGTLIFEN